MSADDDSAPDFSDSDQAWFDRLSARVPLEGSGEPRSPAEREGELLRRALARRRAARQAALASADEAPLHEGPGFEDEAQRQRWLRVQARLDEPAAGATDAGADLPQHSQPDPADTRPPLQPTAAQPIKPRWYQPWRWAGGGALAAGLLAALVIVQRPGDIERIYDEPPELGHRGDATVQRLPVAQPRQAAEALHAALRQAGAAAGLYQQGRVFIVLLQVSSETTPQARAALVAAGVAAPSGPLRLEFVPR